jgi:hypothetical protein
VITDKKFILDLIEKHLNLKQIWSVGVCKIRYMGKTQNILQKKNGKLLEQQFSLKTRKRHLFFLSGLLQQHSFSSRLLPANSKEKLMLHSANLKEN